VSHEDAASFHVQLGAIVFVLIVAGIAEHLQVSAAVGARLVGIALGLPGAAPGLDASA
jgi:Kef-type K+ transport system membrane component KefB